MSDGWVKVYRELLNKPIWQESTPEQKIVLITLLLMVNHEPKEWEWKGEKYVVQPGQCITSLESIALKAGRGISIQNVRTALKRFEKYGFLTNDSTNKNRIITIVNWDLYQVVKDEPNRQSNKRLTGNQQAINKQLTTNKNDKNDKEKIYIFPQTPQEDDRKPRPPFISLKQERLFDRFWQAYPKKKSKGQAERTWVKLNPDEQLVATMTATIERAKKSRDWLKNEGQFIPYPATWLNAKGWEDVHNDLMHREEEPAFDWGYGYKPD